MRQIRGVSTGLTPSDLQDLPLTDVIGTAVCLHEARTSSVVSCEFRDLPQDTPYALKSCLYQFIEETLTRVFDHSQNASVHVCAKSADDRLEVELGCQLQPPAARLAGSIESGSESLRHRFEALGGGLSVRSSSDQHLTIVAHFWIGEGGDRS